MIKRELYFKQIEGFIGKPIIKVITGLRRSGKSFFLKQIIEELKDKYKAKDSNIIYINKELVEFDHIQNYKDLDKYINSEVAKSRSKKKYLLIDEIQDIEEWEKAIRSYLAEDKFDIYITGSNANLLSSELATYITGRYIEVQIYPLSFQEFLKFRGKKRSDEEFQNYLQYGGLPGLHKFGLDKERSYPVIENILNTIVLKDIVKKNNLRNINLFDSILKFSLDNIANTFSAKNIADYFKSQRIKVGVATVQTYISFLEAAFLVDRVNRYDIQGKKHLEVYEKYYIRDLGFRHALLGYREDDISDYLENIVYQELCRRGYKVYIGKLSDLEIDFIAQKRDEKKYIQVSYFFMDNEKAKNRELKPFKKIQDDHPKYLISMEKINTKSPEGFIYQNIIDWLCE